VTPPHLAFVPPARHLLRATDLADARYFEPLGVDDLAGAAGLSRARAAGQPDVGIVLMAIPGAPVLDAETAEQVRDLVAKGWTGTVFLTTDYVHADYEELKGRGVEFVEEPEERPYGIGVP
jgi:hypothetical protein